MRHRGARAPGVLDLRSCVTSSRGTPPGRPPGGPFSADSANDDVTRSRGTGRGCTTTGTGTADHRKAVPDGQYKVVVKGAEGARDPGNPADWEIQTSPTITIDRP